VTPAGRQAKSPSSHAPSADPSVAPSEAPAAEAPSTAPSAESPALSTGVVAAVTHAAEAAFTAVSAAAEKVVSLANGPVDEPPPPETEASETVPEAADDGGPAVEAPDAANGSTQQPTEAGSDGAAAVAELQHPDAAGESDEVIATDEAPADTLEERKLPWSQPAAPPTDQAQKDKCASAACMTTVLPPIGLPPADATSGIYAISSRQVQPSHVTVLFLVLWARCGVGVVKNHSIMLTPIALLDMQAGRHGGSTGGGGPDAGQRRAQRHPCAASRAGQPRQPVLHERDTAGAEQACLLYSALGQEHDHLAPRMLLYSPS